MPNVPVLCKRLVGAHARKVGAADLLMHAREHQLIQCMWPLIKVQDFMFRKDLYATNI